jgi:hypothetical protein
MAGTRQAHRAEPAKDFYTSALKCMKGMDLPFMVGGAYALREYADIQRDTKDLDVFCRAGDYPHLLRALEDDGYTAEVPDANWIAKAFHGDQYVDIIFNSHNGLCPVDDTWFEHAPTSSVLGIDVLLVPAEEEVWTKLYVQDRYRYDGPDVYHIIRKSGSELDWDRLLRRMEVHWQILLAHLINFHFIYPSEREAVPDWVMERLTDRLREHQMTPVSTDRICRGPLLSSEQYAVDIQEWGYVPR